MTDYQKLYHLLFNAITDALEALGHLDVPAATRLLEEAQTRAEDHILAGAVKQGAPAGAPCLCAGKFENVKNFS